MLESHVHASWIHKSRRLETSQESTSRGTGKVSVMRAYKGTLLKAVTRRGALTHAIAQMSLARVRLSGVSGALKGMCSDSPTMGKFRQRAEHGPPGLAEGEGQVTA